MKIDSIEVKLLSIPLMRAITTNIHTFNKLECLVVMIKMKSGLIGESFVRGLGKIPVREIKAYIDNDITPQLTQGKFDSVLTWENFWQAYYNNKTTAKIYALAAVDIAMWDIFAKEKNKPLYKILGAISDKVPVYGTTGWLSLDTKELIQECIKYAKMGVNGFKIRLGHKDDFKRVKAVREAMGNNFILMLDANQRYSVDDAIQIANKMTEFDIEWLEEPVGNSLRDLRQVASRSSIPLAVGENITEINEFERVCQSHAVKFLQPDIIRSGGVTGFIKIANIVKRYDFPLCNHLLPELSASLIVSYKNGYLVEYDDLLPADIFIHDFSIKEGCMRLSDKAGIGTQLTDETIKHYSIL